MKKTLLFLSLSLITLVGFSQARVEVGLKLGANFSNTDVSDVNTDAITSFHGGAYGLIKLANIGIQPEILWSKQGNEFTVASLKSETDLTYVNIPVMIKFYLPLGLNLQAGPQFGILTDAVDETGADISNTIKNSDLSAALGAGWDAPFGLQVSARYVLGLSDINDDPDPTNTSEIKNSTFQIAIGYSLFGLGK